MNRREFLLGLGGSSLALSACQLLAPLTPTPTDPIPHSADTPPAPISTSTPLPTLLSSPTPIVQTGLTLRQKIAQMVMVGFRGETADQCRDLLHQLAEFPLAGILLFDRDVQTMGTRNIHSAEQLTALIQAIQAASPTPLIVATDQEGGLVARLNPMQNFPPFPSAKALGEENDLAATERSATKMATLLHQVGITLNLAPVVDLDLNPDNPVIGGFERSFSADPQRVVAHAETFIRAHHAQGVCCTLKHFPGHGSSLHDSHEGFVDVTELWTREELIPYRELIARRLADAIMTAHTFNTSLDPDYPATLSEKQLQGLLRQELGYGGPILSDDIQMSAIAEHYGFDGAIVQAVRAGVDGVLIANNAPHVVYDSQAAPKAVMAIEAAVETGQLSAERIEEAYQRVQMLKRFQAKR